MPGRGQSHRGKHATIFIIGKNTPHAQKKHAPLHAVGYYCAEPPPPVCRGPVVFLWRRRETSPSTTFVLHSAPSPSFHRCCWPVLWPRGLFSSEVPRCRPQLRRPQPPPRTWTQTPKNAGKPCNITRRGTKKRMGNIVFRWVVLGLCCVCDAEYLAREAKWHGFWLVFRRLRIQDKTRPMSKMRTIEQRKKKFKL